MNALFALALLASPLRAGVVMPVESGVVSPAGPSVTGLPVLGPSQGSLGTPSWGGIDLRGALPMLPAPVPGLAGPSLNFIGHTAAPEAAAMAPQTGAPQAAPAPSTVHGRRAEQTPALPAKAAPGSSTLAISRDRKRAASISDDAPTLTGKLADEDASSPRVEAGRKFFDLGSEKRGGISDPADENPAPAPSGAAAAGQAGAGSPVGAFTGGGTVHSGGASLKSFTGKTNGSGPSLVEGETLHDAVASVPGAAAIPAAGGKVSLFHSAAPNGSLGASAGSRAFGAFGMPKPLALDLSATGLIVRVRSALNAAMGGASFESQPGAIAPVPGPSTALLERGGMLEAFSTAQTHAASAASSASPAAAAPSVAPRMLVPAPISSSPSAVPSLWWALLSLPLFVAAIRRVI